MEEQKLTTGCDRLKHAQSYLTDHGWKQGSLRRWQHIDEGDSYRTEPVGAACLVGALITTEEYKNCSNTDLLYKGNSALYPGLTEAYQFLGFHDGFDAYIWNDVEAGAKEVVIDRIAEARAKHCEDKNGA